MQRYKDLKLTLDRIWRKHALTMYSFLIIEATTTANKAKWELLHNVNMIKICSRYSFKTNWLTNSWSSSTRNERIYLCIGRWVGRLGLVNDYAAISVIDLVKGINTIIALLISINKFQTLMKRILFNVVQGWRRTDWWTLLANNLLLLRLINKPIQSMSQSSYYQERETNHLPNAQ